MGGKIIHDHDVTRGQGWEPHLLDVSQKGRSVHRAVENHRRRHPAQAKTADKGGGFPVPVRNRRPAPFAARSTSPEPGHFGRGAGFVDENQALGIKIRLEVEPRLSLPENVAPLLLAGVRRFFL